MGTVTIEGTTFEVDRCMVEATSNHRPDTSWVFIDAAGHEHRWFLNGQPATTYSPLEHYDTPSLITIKDGVGYWDDGEPYDIVHRECRKCGEIIEPAYTADTSRVMVPGIARYYINGESVSESAFKQRVEGVAAALKASVRD